VEAVRKAMTVATGTGIRAKEERTSKVEGRDKAGLKAERAIEDRARGMV